MENNKVLIILVVILLLLVIGLDGYIVYDKVLNKDNTNNQKNENGTYIKE